MSLQANQQLNIFYRHFDLSPNFPVIGLLGDSWVVTDEPIKRLHFHNCMEIGFLYEGNGIFYIDDKAIPCSAPCITLAPPNIPHFTQAEQNNTCRWKWLYVDPVQLFPQITPQLASEFNHYQRTLSDEDCVVSAAAQPEAYRLLSIVIGEMEKKDAYYQQIVRELLYSVFLMLMRISHMVPTEHRCMSRPLGCISPALSYIAENYMNDLSISYLSQLCHVSISHFRRLFKQVIGWAPQEYLQIIRIDKACELLYNCNYSVMEISLLVGYPSPSSFSRQFKRIYGISPSQWRQKMRTEENPEVIAYFNATSQIQQPLFLLNHMEKTPAQDRSAEETPP